MSASTITKRMENFGWAGIQIGDKERIIGDKLVTYGPATVNGDTYNWMIFDMEGGMFYFHQYPPELFNLATWKEEATKIAVITLVVNRELVTLPEFPTF